eukprot:Amastigsp_a676229_50.p5 type:complete len:102 gc:universal Amastigsp_a676229_50:794-1099(+)
MSSLWMVFERVHEREPNVRPWKDDVNESTESFGAPGAWLTITLSSSSLVNGAPPRSRWRNIIMAALSAFSLAHEPHIAVQTCVMPGGAAFMNVVSTSLPQF